MGCVYEIQAELRWMTSCFTNLLRPHPMIEPLINHGTRTRVMPGVRSDFPLFHK
jgi:hypothetical protein